MYVITWTRVQATHTHKHTHTIWGDVMARTSSFCRMPQKTERGRRRISHWKWKLSFVPRKLKYPPEKLSFQFSPILAFRGGVIRGRKIEIWSYYQHCIIIFYTTACFVQFWWWYVRVVRFKLEPPLEDPPSWKRTSVSKMYWGILRNRQ